MVVTLAKLVNVELSATHWRDERDFNGFADGLIPVVVFAIDGDTKALWVDRWRGAAPEFTRRVAGSAIDDAFAKSGLLLGMGKS